MSDDTLAMWKAPRRRTRGGQSRFSDFAIEAVSTLGAVFGLPLRQTEGFIGLILGLMGLDPPVPDHTTLGRRPRSISIDMNAPARKAPVDLVLDSTGMKFFAAGEWDRVKHGEKRRSWRNLLDPSSGVSLSPGNGGGKFALERALSLRVPQRSRGPTHKRFWRWRMCQRHRWTGCSSVTRSISPGGCQASWCSLRMPNRSGKRRRGWGCGGRQASRSRH